MSVESILSEEAEACGLEMDWLPSGFERTVTNHSGEDQPVIAWVRVTTKNEVEVTELRPLISDYKVTGQGWSADDGEPGREVTFRTALGIEKTVFVPDTLLHGDNKVLKQFLVGAGMWITTRKHDQEHLLRLLNTYTSPRVFRHVPQPGWYRFSQGSDGTPESDGTVYTHFVSPRGEVIQSPDATVIDVRLPETKGVADRNAGGTLEGWIEAAGSALRHTAMPHIALASMAACAGTVLQLIGAPSRGLHLGGLSDRGKSIGHAAAASAWGSTVSGRAMLMVARATDNGLERPLIKANGTSLHIDELGAMKPQTVKELPFLIAGEQNKARANTAGELRKIEHWTTFVTMSSEKPLREIIESAGGKMIAGMTKRVVSISVSQIETLSTDEVAPIKARFNDNYGWAGPEFVRRLFANGYCTVEGVEKIRKAIELRKTALVGDFTENGHRTAAAEVFALLWTCGALMAEAGLFGDASDADSHIERVVRWGWTSYLGTPDADAGNPVQDGVSQLIVWAEGNLDGKVRNLNNGYSHGEALAWYQPPVCGAALNVPGTLYLPKASVPEIRIGADFTAVVKELDRRGMLLKQNRNWVWHKGLNGVPHYRIEVRLGAVGIEDAAEAQAEPKPELDHAAVLEAANAKFDEWIVEQDEHFEKTMEAISKAMKRGSKPPAR